MKIGVIVGTRPEMIKMSPIIREMKLRKLNYFIIHTGQHYSYELDKIFFKELKLPFPNYNLDVGSGLHGEQTAKIIEGTEKILLKEKPDIVLVQGDTNSVLAGALSSSKLKIEIGHIEAGLRAYDGEMPEEKNRIITDHLSDYLFCPTEISKLNLLREGIAINKIFIVGNTIVDSIKQNIKIANKKNNILNKLGLEKKQYFLVTLHREENVDDKERLSNIISGLNLLKNKFNLKIIYPIHPRTKKRIKEFSINIGDINLINPLGYLDFLNILSNARLILTDSGGIQEEACILNIPCVTLRRSTERPETLTINANILAGTNPEKILNSVRKMLNLNKKWENPFGDGNAAKKILDIIQK